MPQLDPSSFASQLFWLAVTFTLLYVLVSRVLLPRVRAVLETREGRLEGDLTSAEQFKREAEEARTVYEKALAESRLKAQSLLAETASALEKTAASRQAELDKAAHAKVQEAMGAIAKVKEAAMVALVPAAEELVTAIVEKLAAFRPDENAVKKAVTDASGQKEGR
jgi:F-type H+-transporting ATPase subunit b